MAILAAISLGRLEGDVRLHATKSSQGYSDKEHQPLEVYGVFSKGVYNLSITAELRIAPVNQPDDVFFLR